jgi:hypothetical protein
MTPFRSDEAAELAVTPSTGTARTGLPHDAVARIMGGNLARMMNVGAVLVA